MSFREPMLAHLSWYFSIFSSVLGSSVPQIWHIIYIYPLNIFGFPLQEIENWQKLNSLSFNRPTAFLLHFCEFKYYRLSTRKMFQIFSCRRARTEKLHQFSLYPPERILLTIDLNQIFVSRELQYDVYICPKINFDFLTHAYEHWKTLIYLPFISSTESPLHFSRFKVRVGLLTRRNVYPYNVIHFPT